VVLLLSMVVRLSLLFDAVVCLTSCCSCLCDVVGCSMLFLFVCCPLVSCNLLLVEICLYAYPLIVRMGSGL
jgi:hypothetical protein